MMIAPHVFSGLAVLRSGWVDLCTWHSFHTEPFITFGSLHPHLTCVGSLVFCISHLTLSWLHFILMCHILWWLSEVGSKNFETCLKIQLFYPHTWLLVWSCVQINWNHFLLRLLKENQYCVLGSSILLRISRLFHSDSFVMVCFSSLSLEASRNFCFQCLDISLWCAFTWICFTLKGWSFSEPFQSWKPIPVVLRNVFIVMISSLLFPLSSGNFYDFHLDIFD